MLSGSKDDYRAMRDNPSASPYLERALAITMFEPGMYWVVEVLSKPMGT